MRSEYWEEAFRGKPEMGRREPAKSTLLTKDLLVENRVENVLIPGLEYERNTKVFLGEAE